MARKVYSEEFRRAAVEQVIGRRHPAKAVAERLGVGYHTLRKWVELAKYNADRSLIPADLPVEQLVRELQKENARLRMERDILKKAAAYFAALEGGTNA